MAKVQNPVIGRSKGSAGGMTFSKVFNKNVMRAKAFEVNNPKTVAQVTQRDFFKAVSALSSTFTPDMLRALFPNRPKGISRRNALFQQLAANSQVVDGVKTPKLSDLTTIGNAQTMDMGTTTVAFNNGNAVVTLDAALTANTDVNTHYFLAVIVNTTKQEIAFNITNALVSAGTVSVPLPSTWESTDALQAIPLITDSKTAITNWSSLSVATRPERKVTNA